MLVVHVFFDQRRRRLCADLYKFTLKLFFSISHRIHVETTVYSFYSLQRIQQKMNKIINKTNVCSDFFPRRFQLLFPYFDRYRSFRCAFNQKQVLPEFYLKYPSGHFNHICDSFGPFFNGICQSGFCGHNFERTI